MIQLAAKYTVARMMERDDFSKRFKAGQSISRARVPVPADAGLRLGGAEVRPGARRHRPEVQPAGRARICSRNTARSRSAYSLCRCWRGSTASRRCRRARTTTSASARTPTPCSPRCCRSPTTLMWRWYTLLSFRSLAEIAALKAEVEGGRNPKDAKVLLAKEITARFHSAAAADAAEQDFINRSKGGVPDEIPEVALSGAPLGIAQLLKQAGLAPSTSEGNRLIDGGGVRVDSTRGQRQGPQAAPPAATSCRSASASSPNRADLIVSREARPFRNTRIRLADPPVLPPVRGRRSDTKCAQPGRALYLTSMVTRRLRGSSTSSAVGIARSRSPRPTASTRAAGKSASTNSCRTCYARLRESSSLRDGARRCRYARSPRSRRRCAPAPRPAPRSSRPARSR